MSYVCPVEVSDAYPKDIFGLQLDKDNQGKSQ